MKIKWGNIFALAILTCLIMLLFRLPQALDQMYFTIRIPYYLNNPIIGLCVFGLACLTIVAIVKILSNK